MADRRLVVTKRLGSNTEQQELHALPTGALIISPETGAVFVTSSSTARSTNAYGIQAVSDDGTYKYFFFEDDNANWYIMRKHKVNKTFTYTKGTGGYASVYQSSILPPSGSPTWADRGATF